MKYVVQQLTEFYGEDGKTAVATGWMDIATVEVEPRITRRTVIKKALAEANIQPSREKLKLRVLDEESAATHEPEAYQPPMEWRL